MPLSQEVLRPGQASGSPGGLGPTPRVSDSVGLAWGLRICISSKFPGDVATAGLGTTHTPTHSRYTHIYITDISGQIICTYLDKAINCEQGPTVQHRELYPISCNQP